MRAYNKHKGKGKTKNANDHQLHKQSAKRCDICGRKSTDLTGVVANGQFYPHACSICRNSANLIPTDQKYQVERGKEEFARETIQPFINGKANPDFIRAYPQHRDMFTAEEINSI